MFSQTAALWRVGVDAAFARAVIALSPAARSLAAPPAAAADRSQVDVCIVGAGPAGLAAAVRLKQNVQAEGREVSVLVVEKAEQVGDHTFSGGVFNPCSLNELFPRPASDPEADYEWQTLGAPVATKVRRSRFSLLSQRRRWWLPRPRQLRNRGNYLVDQSRLCRWLADHARSLGVDIWTSCSASRALFDANKTVVGVDVQRRHGAASSLDHHSISARAVLFAEGAHGVLGEDVIAKRGLRAEAGADPQAYALGFREIWQVPDDVHKEGTVEHVVGYPLGSRAYGGGYLYHLADKRVAIGLVVGLDYKNPYLAPHEEFARWKQHPFVSRVIGGGTRVEHGARITATGGFQSVPECAFAGGALIGCVAGVVNMAQLRGTHMAMKTGILAADAAYHEIAGGDEGATSPLHMRAYHRSLRDSWVMRELEQAQNVRPGFRWGLSAGLLNAAIQTGVFPLLLGGSPWRMQHRYSDREVTHTAAQCKPIAYSSEVDAAATSGPREADDPAAQQQVCDSHIVQTNPKAVERVSIKLYDHIERRICPAGVFAYTKDPISNTTRLHVDASRCLQCMACAVKDPTCNLVLRAPPPGSGPQYGR